MARKKKVIPINCEGCFYANTHSNERVWCMRQPRWADVLKTHWCGEFMSLQIAKDLNLERPND